MSVYQSCLLIIISTLCGWLLHVAYLKFVFRPYFPKKYLGFRVLGILPTYKPQLAKVIATGISKNYFNEKFIEEKIKYSELALQLKPQIESLLDTFLNERLSRAFPMIFNLMGEKTLLKFRGVFMDEVEAALPSLMEDAGNKLLSTFNVEESIEQIILDLPVPKMEKALRKYAAKPLARFGWMGAGAGFVIGLLQCLILAIVT